MINPAPRIGEGEGLTVLDLPQNYFELFDLPVSYALDARRLAERYRDLQAATRRGRFGVSLDLIEGVSAQASTQVGEAYRTLKDPQERARYLLALHTGEAERESATTVDGSSLMEEMELRAALSEAQSSPNPRAALASIMTLLAEQSLALDKELECLFEDPHPGNLETARGILGMRALLERGWRDAEALEASLCARP